MNSRQMQLSFEMKIGQFSNYDFPTPLQSHEIQDYLNEAQERKTEQWYENFEKTELDRTVLGPLIKNQVFSSFATGANYMHTNGHVVNLPNEVWFPIEERCNITYTDCNGTSQSKEVNKVLPLTHDEYNLNKNNPYQKPNEDVLWRMDMGATGSYYKRHEIITDGTVILNSYNLRYLKRPADINLINTNTSELDPAAHDDIVDLAIEIALRSRGVLQPREEKQNQES